MSNTINLKPKILWIDDDIRSLIALREEVERAGFEIELFDGVDAAWEYLANAPSDAHYGVIIDIMMATGEKGLFSNTDGGVRTGEQFLRKAQYSHPEWFVRHVFIIYTITDHDTTRRLAAELGIPHYSKLGNYGNEFITRLREEFLEQPGGK